MKTTPTANLFQTLKQSQNFLQTLSDDFSTTTPQVLSTIPLSRTVYGGKGDKNCRNHRRGQQSAARRNSDFQTS